MTDNVYEPLLTTTNWNEEWKLLQEARRHSDSAKTWDEKAKTFPVKHGSQQGYVDAFLKLAGVKRGESVLDMGCGTGALATPLALGGHHVIACDFSQGMLDVMIADQEQLGVENVDARIMSWQDDWESCGIADGCVDVAIASRSIATYDLEDALMKLDRAARRRVCVTLPCGPSPKSDPSLIAAAGFANRMGRDFLYAFNILAACGIAPEVAYIPNTRRESFGSFDQALDAFSGIVRNAMEGTVEREEVDAIPRRLRPWLEENLVQDESGYHLREERRVTWAFLAWSK